MASAGGSRNKSHEENHSSFTDVTGLLKHSDAQSSDSSPMLLPVMSVQSRISSRRMSGYNCQTPNHTACPVLKPRDIALSTGSFCCGVLVP